MGVFLKHQTQSVDSVHNFVYSNLLKPSQTLSVKENKSPIVHTQCAVNNNNNNNNDHRYSAIGKNLETQHGNKRTKADHLFKVLRKCNSKFDCLVYEMLYIKDIKPSLNTQADSIRAKLFT